MLAAWRVGREQSCSQGMSHWSVQVRSFIKISYGEKRSNVQYIVHSNGLTKWTHPVTRCWREKVEEDKVTTALDSWVNSVNIVETTGGRTNLRGRCSVSFGLCCARRTCTWICSVRFIQQNCCSIKMVRSSAVRAEWPGLSRWKSDDWNQWGRNH